MPRPVCLTIMPQEVHLWRLFEILRMGKPLPSEQMGQAGFGLQGGAEEWTLVRLIIRTLA